MKPGVLRRWHLIAVAGVLACKGPTQPVCIANTPGTNEIDPAVAHTIDTPDGRATLVLPAGVLATRCAAAIRVAAMDDRDQPFAAAQAQRVVLVPNSGVGISLQYADTLQAPATLILRYAEPLPGNAPPSDLRIATVVRGSCGAVEIGAPCTRDPTTTLVVRGGTVMESSREVRVAISHSLSQTYILILPQQLVP